LVYKHRTFIPKFWMLGKHVCYSLHFVRCSCFFRIKYINEKIISRQEKLVVLKDVVKFLKPWGKYNWGRQMLWQAVTRQLTGGYNPRRWL
jgi:hypothetical protein